MKLERTRSGSHPALPASTTPAREAIAPPPVSQTTGDPERERSLQQELDAVEDLAIGDFHGADKVLEHAHDLAAQLIADGAPHLLRPRAGLELPHIDEEA